MKLITISFGIHSLKVLNVFVTTMMVAMGFLLIIKAYMFKSLWKSELEFLGEHFIEPADYALIFGLGVVTVGVIGLLVIWYFCMKHLPQLMYFVLLLILLTMALMGNNTMLGEPKEYNPYVLRLKSKFGMITPAQLDDIQSRFRCCGVEKYTDYVMVWKQWGAPYMEKPNQFLSSVTYVTNAKRGLDFPRGFLKNMNPKKDQGFPKWKPPNAKEHVKRQVEPLPPQKPSLRQIDENKATYQKKPYRPYYDRAKKAMNLKYTNKDTRNPFWSPFSDGWKWSSKVVGGFFEELIRLTTVYCTTIWGAMADVYAYVTPKLIRNWLAIFYDYVINWVDWILGTDHSERRWWYGSGWDDIYFQHLMAGSEQLLPYSCCKNPTKPCSGHYKDTYIVGCRKTVVFRWYMSMGDILILSTNLEIVILIEIIVLYVYYSGIKESLFGTLT